MDVLCIVGPTAVGKTKLSIELAKRLDGEIISSDSMQIYRGMDIGTAKATLEERQNIPHHLIDEKNPDETYSVFEFQKTVRDHIAAIKSRGKLPMMVGGTGLYIKSVLYDYEFTNEARTEAKLYQHLNNDQLYAQLKEVDEKAAADLHPNNRQRVIRALEIFRTSGIKKSAIIKKQQHKLIYNAVVIGLTDEREALYERINQRVDQMLAAGLLEEVRTLYDSGIPKGAGAIQAIGYKELYDYFDGLITFDEARELIKRNSRRYSKRQYTWFNNQMDVTWFNVDLHNFEKTVLNVQAYLENII